MVEQATLNRLVRGSSPRVLTKKEIGLEVGAALAASASTDREHKLLIATQELLHPADF